MTKLPLSSGPGFLLVSSLPTLLVAVWILAGQPAQPLKSILPGQTAAAHILVPGAIDGNAPAR